ncbi:MAG: C40 family peptidase [Muribaculaceae bacterium]|nr:C40 family peptidase [Muribaculaceae bacterium]
MMTRKIYLIIMVALAAVVSMSAAKPVPAKKNVPVKTVTATVASAHAVESDDMTLAAVSKTNPFEIVPAAGMEILGEIGDSSDDFAMVDDMLNYARKFMGVRYVRGGRSPKGFDCSGFTSYVYSQFGFQLSPSSATQYTQGKKISRDEVQPGDLLFFTGRAARSGRVGHVAIAVDSDPVSGEITFIHAARTGIKIDKITAPYYAARFLGARRVIGQ